MRKIVNSFLGQSEGKLIKIKKRIGVEGKKKISDIDKKIKDQVPTKDEVIKRFATPAKSTEEFKTSEQYYNKFRSKTINAQNAVRSATTSVDSLSNAVNDASNYLSVIQELIDLIEPLIEIFNSIVTTLQGAIQGIPAQFAAVGLIVGLGKLLDSIGAKVKSISALIDPNNGIPKAIEFYLNKLLFENAKLNPIRTKLQKADIFVTYHLDVIDSAWAKYTLASNPPSQGTEFADNEGNINEDILGDYNEDNLDSLLDQESPIIDG